MLERRKIVAQWRNGQAGTLITLVRTEGSSYRLPGARLLTLLNSKGYAGTISGGCLESEVVRRANWIVRQGAAVERYSMAFDDTANIPFGLGCGGTVDLLFEPLATPEGEALMQALATSLEGRESTVVNFLPGGSLPLRRVIFDSAGEIVFASAAICAEKLACARGFQPGYADDGRFVERLQAPQRLFVLGAGDDAKPLVETAALLGWSITVADGRSHLAQPERFPQAHQVIVLTDRQRPELPIRSNDLVVVMTHSYQQDRDLLAGILPLRPRYLGLLGSRHRSSLLVAEAAAILGWTIDECCAHLFAPVGLDIGGDGPEAIALAIVAEAQSVCQDRIGSQRRLTCDVILREIESGGASLYLQAQCALNAE